MENDIGLLFLERYHDGVQKVISGLVDVCHLPDSKVAGCLGLCRTWRTWFQYQLARQFPLEFLVE